MIDNSRQVQKHCENLADSLQKVCSLLLFAVLNFFPKMTVSIPILSTILFYFYYYYYYYIISTLRVHCIIWYKYVHYGTSHKGGST